MKKKLKRSVAGLLSLAMILAMAACSPGENNSSDTSSEADASSESSEGSEGESTGEVTPGWQLNADDAVTLTWYIHFSWFTTPWGENLVSQTITEETGIDIEFIVPAGNEAERLNTLIVSDSLPDLVTLGWWEPQVEEVIEAEMVYALDELANEYDPYWFDVANEGRVNWYTKEDGHIYGYPNSSWSPQDFENYDNIASNQTFLVRKDMYEAIGSPDMTTPEGFSNALKAAVKQFPEVNGQPLIPFGAHEFGATGNPSFDEFLSNFLAIPYEKDGMYYDRYSDPELKSWLLTFNELDREGLMSEDIFIDKRAQMEEKIAQGRYFSMLYQRTDLAEQQKILYSNDPDSIYMAIDGPKNSNGDDHTLSGAGINGWTVTMISKNCERPDRAIELFSYLMSEHGQLMTSLGVEGVTWDYVDGVPTMKSEVRELLETDRAAYDEQYGADSAYWMFMDSAMKMQWEPSLAEPLGQLEQWSYPYVVSVSQYNVTLPVDSEESEIENKVDNAWGVVLPELLLAADDDEFEELWESFSAQKDEWEYDRVLEAKTTLMNEAKAKLGLD